jgi:hypothetical protein
MRTRLTVKPEHVLDSENLIMPGSRGLILSYAATHLIAKLGRWTSFARPKGRPGKSVIEAAAKPVET